MEGVVVLVGNPTRGEDVRLWLLNALESMEESALARKDPDLAEALYRRSAALRDLYDGGEHGAAYIGTLTALAVVELLRGKSDDALAPLEPAQKVTIDSY